MLCDKKGTAIEKYVRDYVIFDLETTGVSSRWDEVVEISAIKVENGEITGEFSSLVNPGRHIPDDASAVNGITDEMVAEAPYFSTVLEDFFEFVGDFVLIGHNIHTFDMKFIYRDAEKYFGKVPGNDYIDTLRLAKNYLPQLYRYRLVDLAEHYGISTAGAHRALNDCRMNQIVYEHLAEEMSSEKVKAAGGRLCPVCGCMMKKRSGRYGEFWGCSGYPKCRHTENV